MLNQKESINQQNYNEPVAHVYNPGVEEYRTQVNSRGFTFKPLELTEVPLSLADLIGDKVAYRGLFVVWPNQKLENLDNVKIQGLKNFQEFNRDRIRMEQAYLDERRKAGVSIDMSLQFKLNEWIKFDQELSQILANTKVSQPSRSFFDAVPLKKEVAVEEVKKEIQNKRVGKKQNVEFLEEAAL